MVKKKSGIKIYFNPVCNDLRHYLATTKDDLSTIDEICERIGADKKSKVYTCLLLWRKKFLEYYKDMNDRGVLTGEPEQKWLQALTGFKNNWGIMPLFFSKETREYIVPNFREKLDIDTDRMLHFTQSLLTVSAEMDSYEETLAITGKTPDELYSDVKMLEGKIKDGADVLYCKNCGKNVQETWISCPLCGFELK